MPDYIRGTYCKVNGEWQSLVGSDVTDVDTGPALLTTKSITSNGTYNASSDNVDGYSQVVANVPNTYAAGDEGKVVDNGALVSQTSQNITQNGTYNTTLKNSVSVNVSGGGGVSYQMSISGSANKVTSLSLVLPSISYTTEIIGELQS